LDGIRKSIKGVRESLLNLLEGPASLSRQENTAKLVIAKITTAIQNVQDRINRRVFFSGNGKQVQNVNELILHFGQGFFLISLIIIIIKKKGSQTMIQFGSGDNIFDKIKELNMWRGYKKNVCFLCLYKKVMVFEQIPVQNYNFALCVTPTIDLYYLHHYQTNYTWEKYLCGPKEFLEQTFPQFKVYCEIFF